MVAARSRCFGERSLQRAQFKHSRALGGGLVCQPWPAMARAYARCTPGAAAGSGAAGFVCTIFLTATSSGPVSSYTYVTTVSPCETPHMRG